MPSFLSLLLNFNFYLINFHANILIREIIFNHQNAEFLKCGGIWVLLTQILVLAKNSPFGVNLDDVLSSTFVMGTGIAIIL